MSASLAPVRVQRRRSAGWRMPAGARYVGRGTAFGNPWRCPPNTPETAARLFGRWLDDAAYGPPFAEERRATILSRLPELAGSDLACWCPPGQACHADHLLRLANSPH